MIFNTTTVENRVKKLTAFFSDLCIDVFNETKRAVNGREETRRLRRLFFGGSQELIFVVAAHRSID